MPRAHLLIVPLTVSVVASCVDLASGPDVINAAANNCTQIQQLQEAGLLGSGVRYRGEHGFSFEAFDAEGVSAGVETCRALEADLERLIAAGVPGTTIDHWNPHVRITAARGLADKVAGRAMDAEGLFRTASVAKTYVATLAALLATEGKLDLDGKTLAEYLPEVADRIEYADRITVRQLLNHQSGIPDYFGDGPEWMTHVLDAYARGEEVTEDQALELIYDRPANFEPGTSAAYNNTAYVIASRILSKIAQQPYQDALHERVLEPLGLAETYFEKHDSFDNQQLAHGYRDAAELGLELDDWFDIDQGYGFANGGIVQTARDATAFFRAIPGGEDTRFTQLAATLRPKGAGYGLGLLGDGRCYGHAGNFTGYSTRAMTCPDTHETTTVFSSSTEPAHEEVVDAIIAAWTARQ